MGKDTLNNSLWEPRSVEETRAIYRDWAKTYDTEIIASGYVTPTRVAEALARFVNLDAAVLDFGCGTGLSGKALAAAGFRVIDGTDITREMLDQAQAKGFYRRLWLGEAGTLAIETGSYSAIVATGVISLGAAPPETLDLLLGKLGPGGILAFSYNDPTLADPTFTGKLDAVMDNGRTTLLSRELGPHIPSRNMGSDVIVLQKS